MKILVHRLQKLEARVDLRPKRQDPSTEAKELYFRSLSGEELDRLIEVAQWTIAGREAELSDAHLALVERVSAQFSSGLSDFE